MKLTIQGLKEDRSQWLAAGYELPAFDIAAMQAETKKHPVWVHFGPGNIFRAFHARLAQELLNKGRMTSGITAAEGYDAELVEKIFDPFDNLCVLITLKGDGGVDKSVVGGIGAAYGMDGEEDQTALKTVFRDPGLQLVTFTITEKGYGTPAYMDKVTLLLYERYLAGELPLAVVSTDNCSHNGDVLKKAVLASAQRLSEQGKIPVEHAAAFAAYLENGGKISFPWTMIDKITPRPDSAVQESIKADGMEDAEWVKTAKGSYSAPFVNAEECEYLVIEDDFPNGRPPLEEAGVLFTDRETVNKVETMKVCTCLNPLHTALAIFGCLLDMPTIAAEMKDEDLKKLVMGIGYTEGLPVVVDPGIIEPKSFIDTVVEKRLPNPFLPDTPARIATDTSQKLAIRFGGTIKAYRSRDPQSLQTLKLIPFVFAGWLRYLTAVNDAGEAFEPSADPRLQECAAYVKDFRLGEMPAAEAVKAKLLPLLTDETLFGVDLEAAGLAERVIGHFVDLMAGPGAVRKCLHEIVK